jgi:hypothetical protein
MAEVCGKQQHLNKHNGGKGGGGLNYSCTFDNASVRLELVARRKCAACNVLARLSKWLKKSRM